MGDRLPGRRGRQPPRLAPLRDPHRRPDGLAGHLHERGVASGRHYPVPVHLTAAYAHLGHAAGAFPAAEAWAREELSLPIFPGITEVQQELVAAGVRDYFAAA